VEIHAPHGAAHSWKDLLIQLGTITAGILIALSFEGVREWRHERSLVHEARETIAREISSNLKEVDGENAGIAARQANIQNLIDMVDRVLAKKPSGMTQINVGASLADLNAAGWQTAERMGALAHMQYDEVQRYSKLYGVQQLYADQQRRTFEHAIAALTVVPGAPEDAPPSALEAFRLRLQELRADLLVEEQIGKRLSEEYRKTLQ
jgi:hypothetical protein